MRFALAIVLSALCSSASAEYARFGSQVPARIVGSAPVEICTLREAGGCSLVANTILRPLGADERWARVTGSKGGDGWIRRTALDRLPTTADAVKSTCKRIGGASIGMTRQEAIASCWGKPYRVNETVNAYGRHEQWVYSGGYLYFDDGRLTSIQTSR